MYGYLTPLQEGNVASSATAVVFAGVLHVYCLIGKLQIAICDYIQIIN
jgi:hypothetical protein